MTILQVIISIYYDLARYNIPNPHPVFPSLYFKWMPVYIDRFP